MDGSFSFSVLVSTNGGGSSRITLSSKVVSCATGLIIGIPIVSSIGYGGRPGIDAEIEGAITDGWERTEGMGVDPKSGYGNGASRSPMGWAA